MSCRVRRRVLRQLGIAVFGNAFLASCAPAIGYRAPGSVRSYDILVTRKDSLSREIGRGLKRRGYSVRSAVKGRSEEHTSELQSPCNLVCRLLLEKKKLRCCNRTPLTKMPTGGQV